MKAKKIVGAVIGAGVLLGMSAILAKSGSSASQPLTQAMHIPPARKTGLQWGYIREGLHHTKDEKRYGAIFAEPERCAGGGNAPGDDARTRDLVCSCWKKAGQ